MYTAHYAYLLLIMYVTSISSRVTDQWCDSMHVIRLCYRLHTLSLDDVYYIWYLCMIHSMHSISVYCITCMSSTTNVSPIQVSLGGGLIPTVTSLVKLWRLNSLHSSVIAQWLNSHSISMNLASPSDLTCGNIILWLLLLVSRIRGFSTCTADTSYVTFILCLLYITTSPLCGIGHLSVVHVRWTPNSKRRCTI